MDWQRIWPPLLGGLMIGAASASLLALTAKTAGISGILEGILTREKGELGWKAAFVLGLLAGGVGLAFLLPDNLAREALRPLPLMIVAGLLVGFGTRLGGGCTSGHGVCGIGRLSLRSIIGTVTFIAAGAITVVVARLVEGS
ncbi:MAG: YeeE/YedE family protein [Planctomycetota bacterium]|nr:YeeE/YedE family protein [Planctomycetota bacterium]